MRNKSSVSSVIVILFLMLSSLMISVPDETDRTSNKAVSLEYSLASPDTAVIFADDFEHDTYVPAPAGDYPGNVGILHPSGFTQGMSVGDDAYLHNYSRDCWGVSNYRSHSGSNSLWCAQYGLASWEYNNSTANSAIHRVDQDMLTYYENYITNLSDYDNVTLSFWYWIQSSCPTESWKVADHLQILLFDGTSMSTHWSIAGNHSWTQVTLNIPDNTSLIGFYYLRTLANRTLFEGAYIDDVVLVGHKKPPASALIGDTYLFSSSVGSSSVGLNHFTLTTDASWLSISSSNATEVTISGVPTHEGLYSVSLKANDSVSVTWKNWTVEAYDILEFNSSLAATSIPFGDRYWFNISIQQNIFTKPNTFTLTTDAPWLAIYWQNDTQINISGIASVSGNFNVSLVVNNSYSTAWKNWTIAVGSQPPISSWWYVVITGIIAAIVLPLFLLRWRKTAKVRALRKSSLERHHLPSRTDQKAKKPRKRV